MLIRVLLVVACVLLGAWCGHVFFQPLTASLRVLIPDLPQGLDRVPVVLGAATGGLVWALLDSVRAFRVLRWLRRGDGSQPPKVYGVWGEVTDRTRRVLRGLEHQLRDSENRHREFLAAIQASPNGVILLDPQGHIEWLNQTAAGHFGLDARRDVLQLIGNLVRDPGFSSFYQQGLQNPEGFDREIVVMGRQSLPSRPVRLAVQIHPYGEGRHLMLSRDVTAVEQAEAMRRDFVANVSHEIRTPLTVLSGFIETLQHLPLGPQEQQRYLGLMAEQSQRMQTLVSDLLTLSRLEGSPPPGVNAWIPVGGLLRQCMHEAQALSRTGGGDEFPSHDLVLSGTGCEFDQLAGAQAELQSAMSNLVTNAVRYTPAGGLVELGWLRHADGSGEFFVRDTGPGIAAEHIPRLTERFYRVDRSRSRDTGGTGLGLAIVKHVVQRHGAELCIESVLGRGSCFRIVFPPDRLRSEVA